jgi:DNA-binding NarL/FixJ family response regulator
MPRKKISILIVDESKHFVSRMISLIGDVDTVSVIHTAYSYDEASSMLDHKPDLVFLDIKLRGKNGINLLKRIKDSRGNSEVIMLTNHVGEYYRRQCKKLGALHFLDKTNEFDLVPGMIKEFAVQKYA